MLIGFPNPEKPEQESGIRRRAKGNQLNSSRLRIWKKNSAGKNANFTVNKPSTEVKHGKGHG